MRSASLTVLLILSSAAAYAQAAQYPYEKFLVPILTTAQVPGAYGSMWGTSLTIRNESDDYVEISSLVASCLFECPFGRPPHTTFSLREDTPDPNAGEFIYVGAPGAGKVTFSLRIQDFSRQSQTWGTSIPVVPARNAYTTALEILDVPVGANFRNALRIYDFDTPFDDAPRQVRVRIFDMCGVGPVDRNCSNAAIADKSFAFVQPKLSAGTRATQFPANVVIGNLLDAFPQLTSVQPTVLSRGQLRPPAVRVVIDPITPGLRFWAFVSATNNATQHVTVIAPPSPADVAQPLYVIQPRCYEPAPLYGANNRQDPKMIDDYIIGIGSPFDPQVEAPRIAGKYHFEIQSTFYPFIPFFVARLSPQVVAEVRCEPSVINVQFAHGGSPVP